ncbi:MAG: hypothetical protein ACLGIJ_14080 [Candidatus Limnocylindria bacterium]
MAEDTAAAREGVLAARRALADELVVLEASGRAAIDIPARIRRSPAKAAAIVGGAGFLALKGPQRLFGAARRRISGDPAPFPASILPDEVEKTLRKLGRDGDKVRGALERDFADYARRSSKEREGLKAALLMAAVRPLLARGAKAAGDAFLTPDASSFRARLDEIRERLRREADPGESGDPGPTGPGGTTDR